MRIFRVFQAGALAPNSNGNDLSNLQRAHQQGRDSITKVVTDIMQQVGTQDNVPHDFPQLECRRNGITQNYANDMGNVINKLAACRAFNHCAG